MTLQTADAGLEFIRIQENKKMMKWKKTQGPLESDRKHDNYAPAKE
jgi:hypothetical protein